MVGAAMGELADRSSGDPQAVVSEAFETTDEIMSRALGYEPVGFVRTPASAVVPGSPPSVRRLSCFNSNTGRLVRSPSSVLRRDDVDALLPAVDGRMGFLPHSDEWILRISHRLVDGAKSGGVAAFGIHHHALDPR
jgi:hypothetical protein